MTTRLIALPIFLSLWSAAAAPGQAPAVILVRHAERAGGMSPEVGLSDAGRCRAETLAKMLAETGIRAIYTTEVIRTQQTAEPLAKALSVKPTVVFANYPEDLAIKLRSAKPGEVVLVVGHSNTLPEVIKRLGGGAVPPIGDNEYDRLFLVTLTGPNQAAVVTLRYAGCAR